LYPQTTGPLIPNVPSYMKVSPYLDEIDQMPESEFALPH